ncbi:hypothetical protein [Shewanella surugensis]|uniref:Lipocalin-like domain-containing protein n=1 Tax=Shewanella surugensis TaxID=212020 RepID=A0ABT0LJ16_9GAMM|nr:hypothetical protein [Shewanella surugensis]MCL1127287.1 hypothetical protein [Shewanella surugensis]
MKKSIVIKSILFFFLLLLTYISPLTHATENNVTGTWYTTNQFSYLVDRTENQPFSAPNTHKKMTFHERYMTVEWELVQRPDGIITGKSKWTTYDTKKQKLMDGTDILLGGINRGHIILSETSETHAQLIFDFQLDDTNKMSGIGYNIIGPKEVAMRFELVRKQ